MAHDDARGIRARARDQAPELAGDGGGVHAERQHVHIRSTAVHAEREVLGHAAVAVVGHERAGDGDRHRDAAGRRRRGTPSLAGVEAEVRSEPPGDLGERDRPPAGIERVHPAQGAAVQDRDRMLPSCQDPCRIGRRVIAAVHERRGVRRLRVARPGAARQRLIVHDAGQRARRGVAQRPDLSAEAMGRVPEVVRPVREKRPGAQSCAQLVLDARGGAVGQPDVADPRIARELVTDGVLAVVDDDEVASLMILPEEVPDGRCDERAPVARRHDAGDLRPCRASSRLGHHAADGSGSVRNRPARAVTTARNLRCIAEQPYDPQFFDVITRTATDSAAVVVPWLLEWLDPRSVLDVGCAEGAWLAPFAAAGCRVVGIDGPQVRRERFVPDNGTLVHRDLETPIAGLFGGARFDLALCLEVAEHLSADRADGLVEDLAALADRIVFSAAVPGQGGYGHVNEQPHAYWIRRFEDRGYASTAVLQRRFAGDARIASWYRANLLVFVRVTDR